MLCIFHKWKLSGLYYKQVASEGWSYGTELIERYRCKKCNKEKDLMVEKCNYNYYTTYIEKLKSIRDIGAKNIYDLNETNLNNEEY